MRTRKPIVGNLVLMSALLLVNGVKIGAFLVYWALDR